MDLLSQIENPIVRESLRFLNIHSSVNIDIQSDVPVGSGLGGSSALTVGLLRALHEHKDRYVGGGVVVHPEAVAQQACVVELNRVQSPIGKQDQYIAAYGGFRRFRFERNGRVDIETIQPPRGLEESLMLFDTGIRRDANKVLSDQSHTADPKTLSQMKRQVGKLYSLLQTRDIQRIGFLLHDAWALKKSLSLSISNVALDTIYDRAIKAGAFGGKVLGAGAGGHMLFCVPSAEQKRVIKAIDGLATHVPFRFEHRGTQINMNRNEKSVLQHADKHDKLNISDYAQAIASLESFSSAAPLRNLYL